MEKIKGLIKGFTWIRNSVLENPDMSASDVMVYLSLMRYMSNRSKECWPGILTIMKLSHLGQRTVYACLLDLERMSLISISRKRGRTNRYTILEPPDNWHENNNTGMIDDKPF